MNHIYSHQLKIVGKAIIKNEDCNVKLANSKQINILSECQMCLSTFQNPITLPCGFTLCYDCIPKTSHFQCTSYHCLRVHSTEVLSTNYILKEILDYPDKIQQLLSCSVCLQHFKDPITTECGHTFCKECLIHVMINNKACPICRYELKRIGKVDSILMSWIQHMNNQPIPTMKMNKHIIIFKLENVISIQNYTFHISQRHNQSLLEEIMIQPFQQHYILCMADNEDGILLKINHIEHSLDIRHFVIQTQGLFRLYVHQLQDLQQDIFVHVSRLEDNKPSIPKKPMPLSMLKAMNTPQQGNLIYNQRLTWAHIMGYNQM